MRRPVDLPRGLPHARPTAELGEVECGSVEGLPPGGRAVGLRQVDGTPHEPVWFQIRADRRSAVDQPVSAE